MWSNGERQVELVDLPAFGRPARLVQHRRRWRCGTRPAAGFLDADDPYGESATPGAAEETLRSIYDITNAEVGAAAVAQLANRRAI